MPNHIDISAAKTRLRSALDVIPDDVLTKTGKMILDHDIKVTVMMGRQRNIGLESAVRCAAAIALVEEAERRRTGN